MKNYQSLKSVIDTKEVDKEWLKPCAIGITKDSIIIEVIQGSMQSDKVYGITVKAMAEKKVLILFHGI
ncbi:hypothetical protein U1Q18_040257 [Sarracenia purpurea var. burkii]